MATKSKKNVRNDQADSRAAGTDTEPTPRPPFQPVKPHPEESDESVEDRYNAAVERCGLNMPLLLQEILRELMYLRAGK